MTDQPATAEGVVGGTPGVRKTPAPIWFFVTFGVLLFWGMVYLDLRGGGFHAKVHEPYKGLADVRAHQPMRDESPLFAQGRLAYSKYCLPCHGANGQGTAQAPPLAGSEWVQAEGPQRMIRIALHGLQGPITVKGQEYNMAMAALGALSDEDIAAAITFIRGNPDWGHDVGEAPVELVAEIRAATADRTASWTAGELEQIPVEAVEADEASADEAP
jgi:mono/diheme cytochrome c family protein